MLPLRTTASSASLPVRPLRVVIGAFLLFVAVGCSKPLAMGEANSILVVTPDETWAQIETQVREALEPRVYSVRDERIFNVTQIEPGAEEWDRLYVMRQILVIGPADAEWMEPILDAASVGQLQPPTVVEATNVWAQNQSAVALVIPEGDPLAVESLLGDLGDRYLANYQAQVRTRMFVTGADQALADSLRSDAGFSLIVPNVYRHRAPDERTIIFRNDNPDPSELIRSVTVAWLPASEAEFTTQQAIEWRSRLAAEHEHPPQVTEAEGRVTRLSAGETDIMELHGVWSNPPEEWPAAGPFTTRLVHCPDDDRIYLLDGWVYAPGKPKYEYMYQLETILNSFEC